MIIVSISDIHGRLGPVDKLRPWLEAADLVVLAGDITNFGHAAEARSIIEPLQTMVSRLLAVTGNCDHEDVAQVLVEMGISLETAPVIVDGLPLVGLGGALAGPVPTPHEFTEDELSAQLSRMAEDLPGESAFVLVSHQPPRDTAADRTSGGQHVGSRAVRQFVETGQPLVCFTAHIHESRGISHIGETIVVNPGPISQGHIAFAEVDGDRVVSCEIKNLS